MKLFLSTLLLLSTVTHAAKLFNKIKTSLETKGEGWPELTKEEYQLIENCGKKDLNWKSFIPLLTDQEKEEHKKQQKADKKNKVEAKVPTDEEIAGFSKQEEDELSRDIPLYLETAYPTILECASSRNS